MRFPVLLPMPASFAAVKLCFATIQLWSKKMAPFRSFKRAVVGKQADTGVICTTAERRSVICICEVAQSLYFRSHSGRNGPGGVASFLSFSGLGKVNRSESVLTSTVLSPTGPRTFIIPTSGTGDCSDPQCLRLACGNQRKRLYMIPAGE